MEKFARIRRASKRVLDLARQYDDSSISPTGYVDAMETAQAELKAAVEQNEEIDTCEY